MIVKLVIEDIKPRDDQRWILQQVTEFLDECDPDSRPDLRIEVAR